MGKLTPKRAGYGVITGPDGIKEFDTCNCRHCGRAWIVKSNDPNNKADPGGWCMVCNAMICPTCAGKECKPFLRKLEEYEKRQKLFAEMKL